MRTHPSGAVVLLSGGLDSTTLLHHVARTLQRTPLYALSFRYGQRHSRELDCAREQARRTGSTHDVIDISLIGNLLKDATTLVTGGREVPDLADVDPDALGQPPTYVPNRNMMFLSLAAAFAEAHGVVDVYYGAQAQDEYGYWDCTTAFLDRINALFALNRREPVIVHAPFVRYNKAESLKLGMALGVDFGRTWSCYRGGEVACGTCPTCVERLNAFREIGVEDPLPYRAKG